MDDEMNTFVEKVLSGSHQQRVNIGRRSYLTYTKQSSSSDNGNTLNFTTLSKDGGQGCVERQQSSKMNMSHY